MQVKAATGEIVTAENLGYIFIIKLKKNIYKYIF